MSLVFLWDLFFSPKFLKFMVVITCSFRTWIWTTSIQIAMNPVYHGCTKHIEVDSHYIREAFCRGENVNLTTDLHIVDVFMKAFNNTSFSVADWWDRSTFHLRKDWKGICPTSLYPYEISNCRILIKVIPRTNFEELSHSCVCTTSTTHLREGCWNGDQS